MIQHRKHLNSDQYLYDDIVLLVQRSFKLYSILKSEKIYYRSSESWFVPFVFLFGLKNLAHSPQHCHNYFLLEESLGSKIIFPPLCKLFRENSAPLFAFRCSVFSTDKSMMCRLEHFLRYYKRISLLNGMVKFGLCLQIFKA